MKDDLKSEYPDFSKDDLVRTMFEIVDEQLHDLVSNLDIQLSKPIIVIGDIGRWNGRVQGYKMIESGNIKECFYSTATAMNGMLINSRFEMRSSTP